MSVPSFTIGIEEEFQAVDRQTGQLRSCIYTLLEEGRPFFGERLQSEWVQSMIELTSGICPTISIARDELYHQRAQLAQLMQKNRLSLISAGTHPTSLWYDQEKTNKKRYIELEEEFQDVVRARVLFGLHVHIGVESREIAIELINQLRTWLPHLLAISSNSPFWVGRFTGIKSYRSVVWQSGAPRSGLPEIIPSLNDFNTYVQELIATDCITSGKDIWWYIRPHPVYNTIEFRICDMPATIEDSLAIAALCQALVAKLAWLHEHNVAVPVLPRDYIEENTWRAMRYGLDAKLADFIHHRSMSMRDSIHELLDFVSDVVDDQGSQREMHFLRALLQDERGTGADRQIAVYKQTNDVRQVIHFLIDQTMEGVTHSPVIQY